MVNEDENGNHNTFSNDLLLPDLEQAYFKYDVLCGGSSVVILMLECFAIIE